VSATFDVTSLFRRDVGDLLGRWESWSDLQLLPGFHVFKTRYGNVPSVGSEIDRAWCVHCGYGDCLGRSLYFSRNLLMRRIQTLRVIVILHFLTGRLCDFNLLSVLHYTG
jgi:hypothetical protein